MASKRSPGLTQRNVSPKAKEVTGSADVNAHGTTQPEPTGPVLTEKVWNRLRHKGRLARDEVTSRLPPMMGPLAWQQFQQMPMARWACSLMLLLEPQQAGLYRRRTRPRAGAGLFDDIPSLDQRERAEKIYAELCERHSIRLPSCPWLRPVLAGRARWLATHPGAHGSAWGRRMRRQKGGKHAQKRYREQGQHPLASVRKAWGLTAARPEGASGPSEPGCKL